MLSVLIPAYNEGKSIQGTVEELVKVLNTTGIVYEIIVINDGSSDNTAEVARNIAEIRLINHPINGGYGKALKTGLKHARYDWCCIIDADNTYPASSIPTLMEYVPAFDMVVGARTGKHYWGSFSKRIGRLILLNLVKFIIGEPVPDINSGFRIFRKDIALRHIARISSGFSFTTTLTLAVFLEEHFVKYVDIEYLPRVGSSKVKIRKDSLRMLQILAMATLFYNPLKLFLPICVLTVVVGAISALFALIVGQHGGWVLFPLSIMISIIVGAIGFISESLRLHRIALSAQLPTTEILKKDDPA